jgi:hypothetical protein
LRRLSGQPAFRIFGKATYEKNWRIIDVFATARRDWTSRWPLWRGHCTTLTAEVIAVGWDFAMQLVTEIRDCPVSQEKPVVVVGGRLRDWDRRQTAGGDHTASSLEILAHECGHAAQAGRYGFLYWPLGAAVTLFREGPRWWQEFENQASETGQFGGIVPGTLHPRLAKL